MRLLTLALFALPSVALANDAVISYAGGAPEVVEVEDAAMASEVLVFRYQGESTWSAVLTYTLRNDGGARTLDIGLPFQLPIDDGGDIRYLGETTTLLDGVPVEVTTSLQAEHPEMAFSRIDAVEVPFTAGQSRTLEHRYDAMSGVSADGFGWFEYILTTGAHWDGPIGTVEIRFELPEDATCVETSLPARIDDGWLIVELSDWDAVYDFAALWTTDFSTRDALSLPWEDAEWDAPNAGTCADTGRGALALAYYGRGVSRGTAPGPVGLVSRVADRFDLGWASLPPIPPDQVCEALFERVNASYFSYATVPEALVMRAADPTGFAGAATELPRTAIECLESRVR